MVILGALLVVVGATGTVGVFAAIPNSTTGVISACKNNITGGLRAVDTQAGNSCNGLESALSWNSDDRHSALLRLKPDPNVANETTIDYTRSRNIVRFTPIDVPDPTSSDGTILRYYCIQTTFRPEVIQTSQDPRATPIEIYLFSQAGASADFIRPVCGNGYDAGYVTTKGLETQYTKDQSVFFSN